MAGPKVKDAAFWTSIGQGPDIWHLWDADTEDIHVFEEGGMGWREA